MPVAIVTGSGGLIGSESVRFFSERGLDVLGIDNDMRARFFGPEASTRHVSAYGRYFDMPTVCFRGGCLTGLQHAGAQLHGFLAYLMKCTVTGEPYTIFGYGGKQVRDNIHAYDVVRAFEAFHANPRRAAVYDLGGGRQSNVSMLEAIELCEANAGRKLRYTLSDSARVGDHKWWISDLDTFKADYPDWKLTFGIVDTLRDIYDHNVEQWTATAGRR